MRTTGHLSTITATDSGAQTTQITTIRAYWSPPAASREDLRNRAARTDPRLGLTRAQTTAARPPSHATATTTFTGSVTCTDSPGCNTNQNQCHHPAAHPTGSVTGVDDSVILAEARGIRTLRVELPSM